LLGVYHKILPGAIASNIREYIENNPMKKQRLLGLESEQIIRIISQAASITRSQQQANEKAKNS
jgi:hypothetical protein